MRQHAARNPAARPQRVALQVQGRRTDQHPLRHGRDQRRRRLRGRGDHRGARDARRVREPARSVPPHRLTEGQPARARGLDPLRKPRPNRSEPRDVEPPNSTRRCISANRIRARCSTGQVDLFGLCAADDSVLPDWSEAVRFAGERETLGSVFERTSDQRVRAGLEIPGQRAARRHRRTEAGGRRRAGAPGRRRSR